MLYNIISIILAFYNTLLLYLIISISNILGFSANAFQSILSGFAFNNAIAHGFVDNQVQIKHINKENKNGKNLDNLYVKDFMFGICWL